MPRGEGAHRAGQINVGAAAAAILMSTSWVIAQEIAVPDGYAGFAGTTGGGHATPVTVSTASEFREAVSGDSPAVILVDGRLHVDPVTIGSNKTIAGIDSTSGLFGGTIRIRGSNCIIQNLTLGPSSGDVMEISGATNVFVTRCSFHDSSDELFSIVREADYVTVSWCRFYFENPDSHSFAHLIGNSDDRTSDRGKLHVTMHHNWYAEAIRSRMPRVRYGHVHIYNNYYNSVGNDYCIGIGVECHIRVENTHFEGVRDPWSDLGGAANGEIGWDNLLFESAFQPGFMENAYPVFPVPYEFHMDPVEDVKAIVRAKAGNVFRDTDPSTLIADAGRGAVPDRFTLEQAYPNPFNPFATIGFSIPFRARVRIDVYDLSGRRVAHLVDETRPAGRYEVKFESGDLSSGIYVYRLFSPDGTLSRKMLLIK